MWIAAEPLIMWVSVCARVVERRNIMAQGVSGPPVAMEVHVTGRRILATIVDLIIFSIFFWLLSLAFGSTSVEGGSVAFSLGALGSLIYLVGVFAYYLFMEGYLGQTVGKMLLGIKVIREDTGGVPGLGAAAWRTVLRVIDGILFYAVAFVSVLATQKNRRLGDMAAHTLVVRK
jgi:uncharacterized RDD family membrane protein YckC